MQIFVIMQVAGFRRKERQREQRKGKERGQGRDGETPSLHLLNTSLLHMDAACVQLLLKGHTGSSDAL